MRLRRRIQKLEQRFFDNTGLVTHSREWFSHWEGKIDQLLSGANPDIRGIPLAVVDSIIEAGDEGRVLTRW
jgi:hypothetical protein